MIEAQQQTSNSNSASGKTTAVDPAVSALTNNGIQLDDYRTMSRLVWERFRRHPAAVISSVVLLLLVLSVILVSFSPYDPAESDILNRLQPPSWSHPMGTDPLGRDQLTRVLYGGRISMTVALLVVIITLIIGIPIGAISGYFGGWIDNVLMRITDAALTLPSLLILILLGAILREVELPFLSGNSMLTIALVIGVLSWMTVARLLRGGILVMREMEFVTAANTIGVRDRNIIIRHLLPNTFSPVIVQSTLMLGAAIMLESGLSFLGFGIQPPTPSWGNLLGNAQEHMTEHPWLAIFPGLMIFITVMAINYIGDALRDAMDPHSVF